MWNLPAPPGFRGLRDDGSVTVYHRHLPHWRQDGATYFVTFRAKDSLPAHVLRFLAAQKREWERRHPPPRSQAEQQEFARRTFTLVDGWLDRGLGRCALSDPQCSKQVVDSMHYFDGARYELACRVVMANHVHCVVRPTHTSEHPLESILKSWKAFSGRRINKSLGQSRVFWQDESYDSIIRDEEHLWKVLQYIGRNPETCGLPRESCHLWIRPEWESLGWTFEWRREDGSGDPSHNEMEDGTPAPSYGMSYLGDEFQGAHRKRPRADDAPQV